MLCGDLEGWDGGDGREAQREQIYVCTDSLCCTAETNLTLKQLYSNKKRGGGNSAVSKKMQTKATSEVK